MIKNFSNKGIKIIPGKNVFKSIVKTDRYGNQYVKNFMINEDGVLLQTWDTQNTRVKTHGYRLITEMNKPLTKRYIVWSDTLDTFVIGGFTWKNYHYTWDDADAVYYRDDVDDRILYEVPAEAIDDRR